MNKLIKWWKQYKYFVGKTFVIKTIKLRPKNTTQPEGAKSFYDLKIKSSSGELVDLSTYKGKNVLLINIASKCGYAEQYDELEELYQEKENKLALLGFPSNSFAQEPLNASSTAESCRLNYGVTFPVFEKAPVKGKNQSELYKWLSSANQNGWNDRAPKWNFYKYLINTKGELMGYYSSGVLPHSKKILSQLS